MFFMGANKQKATEQVSRSSITNHVQQGYEINNKDLKTCDSRAEVKAPSPLSKRMQAESRTQAGRRNI